MISSYSNQSGDLRFAICDVSASAHGNCDQFSDWSNVSVDGYGYLYVGEFTSMALDADGDPMISYYDDSYQHLKFATCDMSASSNGNCDQAGDWRTVTVDNSGKVGKYTSIAMTADGNPMISYQDETNWDLRFAICDRSASGNGNCDQGSDWRMVPVDSVGDVGAYTSIAARGEGDPVISYQSTTSVHDLRLASCDLSMSTNGYCDRTSDWSIETVDGIVDGRTGFETSITVDAGGNPAISYADDTSHDHAYLKFALGSSTSVGGIAEIPDVAGHDSSTSTHAAVAGLMAATLLALTAGAWYARRRWGR